MQPVATNLSALEEELAARHDGIRVRGAFVAYDSPPSGGFTGLDFGDLGPLAAVLGVVVLLVAVVQRCQSTRSGRRRRLLVVLTNHGVGIAANTATWRRHVEREWIVPPNSGLRYELDPSEVISGDQVVELHVATEPYWAVGADRDTAYRLYGRQRTRSNVVDIQARDEGNEAIVESTNNVIDDGE